MNKLIQKYDQPESLILVSLYPKKGELYSAGTSGVASYAKNVISPMNRKVVVLADYQEKREIYEEGNALVYRCFKKNSPIMWFSLLKAVRKFPEVTRVLIQLDFALYGSVLTSAFALPFLGILKFLGYKTSVTMHHVVTDIFKLKGHVGLGDGILDKVKGILYNFIFRSFYLY